MSVVGGTLFALAPYHFLRGESHLWLASYYVVPLALLVIVRVVPGRARSGARAPTDPSRWRWARATATVVAGWSPWRPRRRTTPCSRWSSSPSPASPRSPQHRDVRRFLGAVGRGRARRRRRRCSTCSPTSCGPSSTGTTWAGWCAAAARRRSTRSRSPRCCCPCRTTSRPVRPTCAPSTTPNYPLISEQPVLGGVAALGMVALLVIVVLRLAQRGSDRASARVALADPRRASAPSRSSPCCFGTVGGVSSLISFLTPDLRGWNRISIYHRAALARCGRAPGRPRGGLAARADVPGRRLRSRSP